MKTSKICFQVSTISNQHVLVGDFNGKLSKWYASDKDNKAGQDIDTFTTTSTYNQMVGQPMHIVNDSCYVLT